ncbi:uncharacterized protein LOC124418572 [Lucilia cuprina]|uniref:uncharacterized protein LOC124418572 n=1 Tax=Lucilia cuprina TaxID=7375 RepID=UPI001F05E481|nr:uncharacterized protein LOC124418572 [Lucilia cuprina]
MCSEIRKHPELASNKQIFGENKNKTDELWAEICSKLNAVGPPSREIVEWKKVWSDLKGRTKKKIVANHKSLITTGGGAFHSETLSALEEMVDEAANIRSAAIPDGEGLHYHYQKR